jgi:hypothetical protein
MQAVTPWLQTLATDFFCPKIPALGATVGQMRKYQG